MDPSLRPREQIRSDLIGFLLYAIAEDPAESVVSFQKLQIHEKTLKWDDLCLWPA